MDFSRQEYRSGLPFPSLGDFPDSGMEPESPSLQVDSLLSEPPGKPIWQRNSEITEFCLDIDSFWGEFPREMQSGEKN